MKAVDRLEKMAAGRRPPGRPRVRPHRLRDSLVRFFGLSEEALRWELARVGQNVYPFRLRYIMDGMVAAEPDEEAALRRVAAEYVRECELSQGEADLVVAWWLKGSTDQDCPV